MDLLGRDAEDAIADVVAECHSFERGTSPREIAQAVVERLNDMAADHPRGAVQPSGRRWPMECPCCDDGDYIDPRGRRHRCSHCDGSNEVEVVIVRPATDAGAVVSERPAPPITTLARLCANHDANDPDVLAGKVEALYREAYDRQRGGV